jgi:glycosyltransferase involved in cell wall biosynthesis
MPQKHMDVLLRIWDRVRSVVGGELVIAGDGPERRKLEAMRPVDVRFAGQVSETQKHRLLCEAWLLLHPSACEGWGLVISEAAIRCTPAIGFSVPGVRDSVIHGQTGLLAGSEDEFASYWLDLSANHARRCQMGEAARRNSLHDTWSRTVRQFAEVLADAQYEAHEVERVPVTSPFAPSG